MSKSKHAKRPNEHTSWRKMPRAMIESAPVRSKSRNARRAALALHTRANAQGHVGGGARVPELRVAVARRPGSYRDGAAIARRSSRRRSLHRHGGGVAARVRRGVAIATFERQISSRTSIPPDRASTTSPAVTLTEPPWPCTPEPLSTSRTERRASVHPHSSISTVRIRGIRRTIDPLEADKYEYESRRMVFENPILSPNIAPALPTDAPKPQPSKER